MKARMMVKIPRRHVHGEFVRFCGFKWSCKLRAYVQVSRLADLERVRSHGMTPVPVPD